MLYTLYKISFIRSQHFFFRIRSRYLNKCILIHNLLSYERNKNYTIESTKFSSRCWLKSKFRLWRYDNDHENYLHVFLSLVVLVQFSYVWTLSSACYTTQLPFYCNVAEGKISDLFKSFCTGDKIFWNSLGPFIYCSTKERRVRGAQHQQ